MELFNFFRNTADINTGVAENLSDLGIDITLVEAAEQLMAPFDRDMASFIHAEIRKNGINLMLDTMVEALTTWIRALMQCRQYPNIWQSTAHSHICRQS